MSQHYDCPAPLAISVRPCDPVRPVLHDLWKRRKHFLALRSSPESVSTVGYSHPTAKTVDTISCVN